MTIRKYFKAMLLIAFAFLILISGLFGCNTSGNGPQQAGGDDDGGSQIDSNVSTDMTVPVANASFSDIGGYEHFDASKKSISFSDAPVFTADNTLSLNLTNMTVSEDGGAAVSIPEASSKLAVCSGALNVYHTEGQICLKGDGEGDEADMAYTKKLLINLSGTSQKGIYISVKKKAFVKIVLDGCTINSGNYPCIMNDGRAEVQIDVKSGTVSSLMDGRVYGKGYSVANGTDFYDSTLTAEQQTAAANAGAEKTAAWANGDKSKGTIFTKGNLYITGTGTLNVTQGYKHGIVSSKGFIRLFDKTVIVITSTGRNGFHAATGFIMDDGDITISGRGEYKDNESKGIVVEGFDEEEEGDKTGFIVIKGGKLKIDTVSKAITAKWTEDDRTVGLATDYTPSPFVLITGGEIEATTTGTPYESTVSQTVVNADGVSETSNDVSLSPEGIEGKANLYIYGGRITCNTTDDCLNVSSTSGAVEINGGYVYAYSSSNDCIDSNGKLKITGGVVVAFTTKNPECAFDCDQNEFSVTGGTLIGIGTTNYSKPTASACLQGVIVISGNSLGSKDKLLSVKDSSGNIKFAYNVPVSANQNLIAILSSPEFKNTGSYSIVSGATPSGGKTFHGLYTEMPTSSGGSEAESSISFSSSFVFTQSGATGSGPQEGGRPQGPGGGQGGKNPFGGM